MPQSITAAGIQSHLESIGYRRELLAADFQLGDGTRVPLVAFAQAPADARSACIAVLEAEEGSPELVRSCHSLAAPLVLVCGPRGLEWWKQGAAKPERQRRPIPPDEVQRFFKTHADDFAPSTIYRAKTWGRFDAQFQLSFVDFGLMPLIEKHLGGTLVQLISQHVQTLKSLLKWDVLSPEKGQLLLRYVFWLVSAKILHDKRVGKFQKLDLLDAEDVLNAVGEHFHIAAINITSEKQRRALSEVAARIAQTSSLQLATTEALAHVYENTLISKATRQQLGTHSTPSYLVDYIVGRLRPWIEEIPVEQRHVFEPACGHAAFLVSAMRLLTELLPDGLSTATQRRAYLRRRIHGCDIDAFALEIARLSLSLTDIPNPDGWDLIAGDMFVGDALEQQARKAMVLLANPPFENFKTEDRTWYTTRGVELRHVNKTAEMLARVLPELPRGAVVGLVVPQGFLHSQNATPVRKLLTSEFELQEICLFPDKVFTFSDMESAALIARKTGAKPTGTTQVRYRRVRERGMEAFKRAYAATSEAMLAPTTIPSETADFRVPELRDLWEWCGRLPRFRAFVDVGQGLQYKGAGLPAGAQTISEYEFPGAVRGFARFERDLQVHELPRETWMSLDRKLILRESYGAEIGQPQVLFNEAPTDRGPWRLKALVDVSGHPLTRRFNTVRSLHSFRLALELIWSLCNSPIANAFAYSHSGKRHNDAGMFREMPVPGLEGDQGKAVVRAARDYLNYVRRDPAAILQRPISPQKARSLLLRVDCEVLKLYDLPRELEWQLLKFFDGWPREGVPFQFDRYFPEHFDDHITLAEYLAITDEWEQTNERRVELIEKKIARTITPAERTEFEHLQFLAGARQNLLAPLPLKELEALNRELLREVEE
ncbi:MAG: N-6 DNA methylase [Planctomycetota bacterium]|nr:N-6 DNA methylase [Planctomycetota bacterium]